MLITNKIKNKIYFKLKMVKRDKEGHYIMVKGSIHQEDITIVNIDFTNIRAHKYIKQKVTELKRTNKLYYNNSFRL